MNHVSDDILDAVDAYGQALLTGSPAVVSGTLRSDLRVHIEPPAGGTARCRYEIDHTAAPETLRGQGSYVATLVDTVDGRLRSWGIEAPTAYKHTDSTDGTQYYEGKLRLPGVSSD